MKTLNLSFLLIASLSNAYSSDLISQLQKEEYSSSFLYNISLYGLGEKISETNYSGLGIKYNSDYSELILEKADSHKKTSIVQRFDLNSSLYSKLGLGYLNKRVTIDDVYNELNQLTLGCALGYGKDNLYNIELGYFENKVSNLDFLATTQTWYSEVALKYDFKNLTSIDTSLSYHSTKSYDKKISNYSASSSFYPREDFQVGLKYNSIGHNQDIYKVSANINYSFNGFEDILKGTLTPSLTYTENSTSNISLIAQYKEAIAKRSLKIKNKFKEVTNTNNITAQQINLEKLKEELL